MKRIQVALLSVSLSLAGVGLLARINTFGDSESYRFISRLQDGPITLAWYDFKERLFAAPSDWEPEHCIEIDHLTQHLDQVKSEQDAVRDMWYAHRSACGLVAMQEMLSSNSADSLFSQMWSAIKMCDAATADAEAGLQEWHEKTCSDLDAAGLDWTQILRHEQNWYESSTTDGEHRVHIFKDSSQGKYPTYALTTIINALTLEVLLERLKNQEPSEFYGPDTMDYEEADRLAYLAEKIEVNYCWLPSQSLHWAACLPSVAWSCEANEFFADDYDMQDELQEVLQLLNHIPYSNFGMAGLSHADCNGGLRPDKGKLGCYITSDGDYRIVVNCTFFAVRGNEDNPDFWTTSFYNFADNTLTPADFLGAKLTGSVKPNSGVAFAYNGNRI